MVIHTPPLKGRWEVDPSEVEDCGQGHPHPISKKKVEGFQWPLPFFT